MEKLNIVSEDEGIDLIGLARALWKNILAIALVAVIFGSIAFGYTAFLVSPTYTATASLYVNNSSFRLGETSLSVSTGELNASSSLVSIYLYILRSRSTMEDVIREADLTYSPSTLKSMISAKGVTGTSAFEVTVTSRNPAEAEKIANAVAKVLPDRIAEIVDGSSVRVVDYAIIPASRSGPNLMKNTSMGIAAGAFLCAALIALRFLLDQRSKVMIQNADELRTMYPGTMVLAMIPDMRVSEKKNGYYSSYYYSSNNGKKEGKKHG